MRGGSFVSLCCLDRLRRLLSRGALQSYLHRFRAIDSSRFLPVFLLQTLPASLRLGSKRAADSESDEVAIPATTIWSLLKTRRVLIVLANYCALATMSMSVAALVPLYAFTPIDSGGDYAYLAKARAMLI